MYTFATVLSTRTSKITGQRNKEPYNQSCYTTGNCNQKCNRQIYCYLRNGLYQKFNTQIFSHLFYTNLSLLFGTLVVSGTTYESPYRNSCKNDFCITAYCTKCTSHLIRRASYIFPYFFKDIRHFLDYNCGA